MEKNISSNAKQRYKNEIGCKVWASSCVIKGDGTRYYVDNTEDNIREQMNSEKEFIEVELAKIISDKITRIKLSKEQIKEYYSVKN